VTQHLIACADGTGDRVVSDAVFLDRGSHQNAVQGFIAAAAIMPLFAAAAGRRRGGRSIARPDA